MERDPVIEKCGGPSLKRLSCVSSATLGFAVVSLNVVVRSGGTLEDFVRVTTFTLLALFLLFMLVVAVSVADENHGELSAGAFAAHVWDLVIVILASAISVCTATSSWRAFGSALVFTVVFTAVRADESVVKVGYAFLLVAVHCLSLHVVLSAAFEMPHKVISGLLGIVVVFGFGLLDERRLMKLRGQSG